MRKRILAFQLAAAFACALAPGVPSAQDKQMSAAELREQLRKEVPSTIARYRKVDSGIERFFKNSTGYVVFPRIGKMGFIIGGGHGAGELFEKGKLLGTASVTLATVGLQAGAQEFSQIIFFENQAAVDRFKQNKFEFTANISAVILNAGASNAANYRENIVMFTHATGEAIAEIALGTQKFSFKPEDGPAKK